MARDPRRPRKSLSIAGRALKDRVCLFRVVWRPQVRVPRKHPAAGKTKAQIQPIQGLGGYMGAKAKPLRRGAALPWVRDTEEGGEVGSDTQTWPLCKTPRISGCKYQWRYSLDHLNVHKPNFMAVYSPTLSHHLLVDWARCSKCRVLPHSSHLWVHLDTWVLKCLNRSSKLHVPKKLRMQRRPSWSLS